MACAAFFTRWWVVCKGYGSVHAMIAEIEAGSCRERCERRNEGSKHHRTFYLNKYLTTVLTYIHQLSIVIVSKANLLSCMYSTQF